MSMDFNVFNQIFYFLIVVLLIWQVKDVEAVPLKEVEHAALMTIYEELSKL